MIDFRVWIARSLSGGAIVTAVLAVTVLTWGLLLTMGDAATASALVGLVCVLSACWGLNFVALVVLLAGNQLAQLSAEDDPGSAGPQGFHDG